MRISLDWLHDYIDLAASAEEIAELLSNLGLACEGIEMPSLMWRLPSIEGIASAI